jgi:hypothetical protein
MRTHTHFVLRCFLVLLVLFLVLLVFLVFLVYLVTLVFLVYLVTLVFLVYLVTLVFPVLLDFVVPRCKVLCARYACLRVRVYTRMGFCSLL